jgi:RHS repeat-associated protein
VNTSHWKIRDLGGRVLRDYVVTGDTWQLSRDYVYRGEQLLAAVTPTERLSFSLDHLGTPRVITRADRTLAGFHQYLPYGEEWTNGTGVQEGEPKKFTSHERDRDPSGAGATELDYMHARFYSGRVGRFLSPDPIFDAKRALRQPQMWNRYAYALNNPLRFIDPTGMLTYQATVLGMEVRVHIDDEIDEKTQLALKATIDASFAKINSGQEELTKVERGIVRLIKALEVGGNASGVNTQTGQFTMFAPHLMMQSSDAFAADYVHDSKHVFNANPLNPLYTDWFVAGHRQNLKELDERDASEFAVRVGAKIGLDPEALWKYQRVLVDSICDHQWWRDR